MNLENAVEHRAYEEQRGREQCFHLADENGSLIRLGHVFVRSVFKTICGI